MLVDPPVVQAGARFELKGQGLAGFRSFQVVVNSTPVTVGTLSTDYFGRFSDEFIVPADLPPGAHTVTVTDGTGVLASSAITVVAAASTTTLSSTTTTLPAVPPSMSGGSSADVAAQSTSSAEVALTGRDSLLLALVGVGVFAIGTAGRRAARM